ncbi:MAG TPA: AbrB/MazE/SpoVT family DNA-binding domain-containing protein [Sphingomonadaceae bacterium]|nr:AbrB/MazE/SpoVT family DNA-binding domain-containing protein [Sphingomonadaceae bacterium]
MNKPLKIIKIGNSAGIVLPKELLDRLGVEQGDSLTLIQDGDGISLKPHDPEFERQLDVARSVMERRKKALRELAK